MNEYITDFPGCEDVLRYVLCANAPETKDNDFTWKDFQDRNNSELVAIFGNFVNRTWVLMHKLCMGKVPRLHEEKLDDTDRQMMAEFGIAKAKVEESIEQFKFREALFEVIDLARKGNKYLQEKEPWILAKNLASNPENQEGIDNCLHICLQLCANLSILINPFLPFTAKKLIYMMKVVEKMLDWENAGKTKLLSVGYSLREPQLLFRKIEDEEVAAQVEKLKAGRRESGVGSQESGVNSNESVGSRESGAGRKESGVGSREPEEKSRESGVRSRESTAKYRKRQKQMSKQR